MTAHRDSIPPRPLTGRERLLLLFLLSEPFPGRDDLLRQSETVQVCGECACSCTTIDLLVPEPVPARAPGSVPIVDAYNYSDSAAPVEVLLHTRGGVLHMLEVVWYGEQGPLDRIDPSALTLLPPQRARP
jgi:hypothetical protein